MDNSQPLFQLPGNIPNVDLLAVKADELRVKIRSRQPATLANATGTVFAGGELSFDFWNQPMRLTFPELRVFNIASNQEMPTFHQPFQEAKLRESLLGHAGFGHLTRGWRCERSSVGPDEI